MSGDRAGKEKAFPVMWPWRRHETAELTALGCPRSVPWRLLESHEAQARLNHGQSLEVLASRGGLSVSEMVAVIQNRAWRQMLAAEAVPVLVQAMQTKPEEISNGRLRTDLEDATAKLRFVHQVLVARSKAGSLLGGRTGRLAGAAMNLQETFWRIKSVLEELDDEKP